jgi:hypothetical protein
MNVLSEKQLSALTASHSETALLRKSTQGSDGLNTSTSPSKTSMQKIQKKLKAIELPFALIQIHREVSGRNAINLASTSRRPVRSYVRICGTFPSCAKAKDMADLQMEQYYLQLYHSEATKEEELLLNWQTFNGYDTMALDATDHFLIFCRSTPVEFATLRPSKNIFNVRFPAMCKPQNQRYAVLLVNPIPPTSTEHIKQSQKYQQEDVPEDSASSDDEKDTSNPQQRRHSTRKMQFKNLGSSAMGMAGTGGSNGSNAPMMGASLTNTGSGNAALVNFQLSATEVNHTGVGMNKDGKPIHLTELSIVQETIAVTSTRLEGLRYAINHFGRVIPARTTVSVNGVGHRLPMSDLDASVVGPTGNGVATGNLSEDDVALHSAIMSTPYEQLDPQQQQLQDMLITTFVANQQLLWHEQQDAHEGESAFRTKHEHEQHLSHAAAAGKRRLGNRSVFFSPHQKQVPGVNAQVLSNDPKIHQSMELGAITVILKPPSNASLSTPLDATGASSTGITASSSTAGERILRLLHNSALQNPTDPSQRLQVCVLPLFRWILIDSPTLDILNFTKAFHEEAIKNIFLAEQEEFAQQRHQLSLSPRSALSSRANSHQQHQRRPRSTSSKMGTMTYYGDYQQANALDGADCSEDDQDYDHHHPEVFEYHSSVADQGTSSVHPQQACVREINQYRDFTREVLNNQQLPPQLLSSMSEAGLLPKKTAKAVSVRFSTDQHSAHRHVDPHQLDSGKKKGKGTGHSSIKSGGGLGASMGTLSPFNSSHAGGIELLHHTTGQDAHPHDLHRLQNLQQEIASQEIAQQMQQIQLRQAITLTSEQLIETDPLINRLIDATVQEDQNSVYHVAGGNRMSAIDKEIAVTGQQLSQTIEHIQTTIAMTGQALQVHDTLCDLEYSTHNRFAHSSSAVAQQKSLDMLNRRMDVIEGLQKLSVTPSQPQPVTLFTLFQQATASNNGTGGGANNNSPTPAARRPQKGLISAKFTNSSSNNNAGNSNSGTSGNTLSSNVNVAKRLNETLKVLSETIDGPYKRQMQDLQRTKEIEQQEKANRMGKFANSTMLSGGAADATNASIGGNVSASSNNASSSSPAILASSPAPMIGNNNSNINNNNNASSANSVVSATASLPSLTQQISQSSMTLSV